MSFLIINFCFKSIPPYLFKKKYFFDFIPFEGTKGTILCNNRENVDTIKFIKDGEIELKLEISLFELKNLIFFLIEKTNFNFDPNEISIKVLSSII